MPGANFQPEELKPIREQIDAVDRELVNVLVRRAMLTVEAQRVKESHGMCIVRNKVREHEIVVKMIDDLRSHGIKATLPEVFHLMDNVIELGMNAYMEERYPITRLRAV